MSKPLAVLAALLSALALYLPTRTQAFTSVTIDGHRVRMLVAGSGEATVVLETGGGGSLENWGKVQPAVSRFAKTVSYDRAGHGFSGAGLQPRDARRIAIELHDALRLAGIAPPYILAGASMGGPYVRVFAAMYPDEVAGMLLVDPTNDTQRFANVSRAAELDAWDQTGEQARASDIPAGMPVFLIDAVSPLEVPFTTAAVRAMRMTNRPEIEADSVEYKRWLEGIPGGHLIVTRDSGHNVMIEQPDLVIATLRQVIDEARKLGRLSKR